MCTDREREWKKKKFHFRSLDTWLDGKLPDFAPELCPEATDYFAVLPKASLRKSIFHVQGEGEEPVDGEQQDCEKNFSNVLRGEEGELQQGCENKKKIQEEGEEGEGAQGARGASKEGEGDDYQGDDRKEVEY